MVRDKVIFIDSDGTVMDSMTLKHELCFGPAIIETYHLKDYQEDVLMVWNKINLYSLTRGINRFDGHYLILKYINDKYQKISFLAEYKAWLDSAWSKSNECLEEYLTNNPNSELVSVLNWSRLTNELIVNHQDEVIPFSGSVEIIKKLYQDFYVIIISSANNKAVMHEWEKFGLLPYVDEVCTQEIGSKSHMIELMLKKYQPTKAIMLGDAISDLKAADSNNIYFYPIIPRQEVFSWKEFFDKYSVEFKDDNYTQGSIVKKFIDSLEED